MSSQQRVKLLRQNSARACICSISGISMLIFLCFCLSFCFSWRNSDGAEVPASEISSDTLITLSVNSLGILFVYCYASAKQGQANCPYFQAMLRWRNPNSSGHEIFRYRCRGSFIRSLCNFVFADLEMVWKARGLLVNKFNLRLDPKAPICHWKHVLNISVSSEISNGL